MTSHPVTLPVLAYTSGMVEYRFRDWYSGLVLGTGTEPETPGKEAQLQQLIRSLSLGTGCNLASTLLQATGPNTVCSHGVDTQSTRSTMLCCCNVSDHSWMCVNPPFYSPIWLGSQ